MSQLSNEMASQVMTEWTAYGRGHQQDQVRARWPQLATALDRLITSLGADWAKAQQDAKDREAGAGPAPGKTVVTVGPAVRLDQEGPA